MPLPSRGRHLLPSQNAFQPRPPPNGSQGGELFMQAEMWPSNWTMFQKLQASRFALHLCGSCNLYLQLLRARSLAPHTQARSLTTCVAFNEHVSLTC